MKTIKSTGFISCCLLSFVLLFSSCKKDTSSLNTASATSSSIQATEAVGVSLDSATNDSIYVIGTCERNHHLDSIAASSLPSAISEYLTTNYPGYTFEKAFTDEDSSGNVSGYIAIIQYNGKPVGLKFDASGNFVSVLEQREGRDLIGKGWHDGGCFSDRDGRHKDTVALSALPASILSYYKENYPGDTLVKAYENRDSSYIIFSVDNGVYATAFNAQGTVISRMQLHDNSGDIAVLPESALPSAITAYLTSTYPDYVFKEAFSYNYNGTVAGYIICVDANGTKYAVLFDATGNFIKSLTIR